jgi:signal transduction histidine kinase
VELSEVEQKWSQRLERERKARRQAEQHAEQGLRELWMANQRLEQAVVARTAELDRSLAALDFAERTRRLLLADLADELLHPLEALESAIARGQAADAGLDLHDLDHLAARALTVARVLATAAHAVSPVLSTEPEIRSPQTVMDELVRRWQIPFARRGKLLAPNLSGADHDVALCWQPLVGAADAVLESAAQHSLAGTLEIELAVAAETVTIHIVDTGMPAPSISAQGYGSSSAASLMWLACGEQCIGLAVAQRMVNGTQTSLFVAPIDEGGTSIAISAVRPQP